MAIKKHVMALGTPPLTAEAICGGLSQIALVATGSGQSDAYKIPGSFASFGTVAASTGAQLAPVDPGDEVFVYNAGANTLSVYGQTGEAIGAGAANAAFSVAANKGCTFKKVSTTLWGVNLSA